MSGRDLVGRVAVLSEHDQAEWARRFREGRASARRPYGMERLEQRGLELRDGRHAHGRLPTKAAAVLDHRTGTPFSHALLSTPAVRHADLVVAVLDQYGRAAAALRRRRLGPWASRPVATLTCWLGERLSSAPPAERPALVEAFRGVDLLTVWSRNQVAVLVEAGFAPERVAAIPFGIDVRYFTPGRAERSGDVLAVGMDAGRDYATLFDAVRGTDVHVDLVCKPTNLAGLEVPANVSVHSPVPHDVYRDLLRQATVVVVPCRELAYPTGQSVVLEASATGACVVTTDTLAMREYVTDGVTGRTAAPGDSASLRAALESVLGDDDLRSRLGSAARERVVREFSSDTMWDRFADLLVQRGWISET